jgi:hypothetical protein
MNLLTRTIVPPTDDVRFSEINNNQQLQRLELRCSLVIAISFALPAEIGAGFDAVIALERAKSNDE